MTTTQWIDAARLRLAVARTADALRQAAYEAVDRVAAAAEQQLGRASHPTHTAAWLAVASVAADARERLAALGPMQQALLPVADNGGDPCQVAAALGRLA